MHTYSAPDNPQHPATEGNDIPPVTNQDIVIVGLQPWYFKTGCNAKNIATLLAANNRVLYVNFPIKRKAFFAGDPDPKLQPHLEILRGRGEKIKPIAGNLWEFYPGSLIESVNGLPNAAALKTMLYLINNRNFARDIRKAIKTLGFRDIILFNDNDVYNGFYLKELLRPSLYIYYLRDFLQGYPYWKKHVSALEPILIRKADLVVANSMTYTEYSSQYNAHSFYMGQGCDFTHFDASRRLPVPGDIAQLQGPIIGYIGALDSERLDTGILAKIARNRPQWNIVLVGPEDQTFRDGPLHEMPNILFMGARPFSQLSAYVQAFDVCINPQLVNHITRGNYPLKIDEYLAMGKPVVGTRTEAMKLFQHHTLLADRPEDYTGLIETALAQDSPAQAAERIRFARTHSWENCIRELYKGIHSIRNQSFNNRSIS